MKQIVKKNPTKLREHLDHIDYHHLKTFPYKEMSIFTYIMLPSFLSFWVILPTGHFYDEYNRQTGWFHILLNYIGPNDGEGIRIYYD